MAVLVVDVAVLGVVMAIFDVDTANLRRREKTGRENRGGGLQGEGEGGG